MRLNIMISPNKAQISWNVYQCLIKLIKWLHVPTLVLMIPRDNKFLKQDKGQNKKYSQNLQNF